MQKNVSNAKQPSFVENFKELQQHLFIKLIHNIMLSFNQLYDLIKAL